MSTESKPLARSLSPATEDTSAKRIKLDDIPAPPAVPTSIYSLPPSTFKFCNQDGLIGVLDQDGQYHLRERDVGISEYFSTEQGKFEGIVKQRFEDFMVYEVNTEGEIVHLKELALPEDPFNQPKEKKTEEKPDVEEEAANDLAPEASASTATSSAPAATSTSPATVDQTPTSTEDTADDLPAELRLAPHAQWSHSTTRALQPHLSTASIIALHDLLLQGRTPPRPPPERPSDGGWGGMKRRDHAKEEEEAMNEMNGEPQVLLSGRERAQGRDRGRGRGGMRGGRGGMMGGHMERIKDEREVLSDVITDKAKRTEFHATIRNLFTGTFETFSREVAGETGSSRIAIKWASKGGAQKPKPKRGAHDDDQPKIPKYIHFTLQKTNRDTQDCLNHISRILRVDGKTISTCGTKDKRGITVQRVCMQRKGLKLAQVWKAANGLSYGGRTMKQALEERGERGVRIGDLKYSDEYLELGMLKGNHFTITLRNVKAESPELINNIMESMKSRGFINYYGMQRFGTASVSTHSVGLALLKGQWKEACEMLLSRRQGEHPDCEEARKAWWERGDPAEALKLMPRRNTAERAIWEFWARPNQEAGNYFGGLLNIPRNLRLIYVHAYQSYVWNLIVSERIRLNPTDPIVGDLVFAEEKTLEEEGKDAQPSSYRGNPKRNWQTSSSVEVKILKEADLANYTLADVIVPLPGYDITYPEGALFERYQAIMQEDGLDPLKMRRNQKEYSLEGSYRKIIHMPGHLSWKHLRYNDPDVSLTQSDEDKLLGLPAPEIDVPGAEFAALQLSLTLGTSSYATMALRELTKEDTSAHHQTKLTANADDQKAKTVADDNAEEEQAIEEGTANRDDKMEVEPAT